MTHPDTHDEQTEALVSRLRLIEDQPIDTRASAYAAVHEELKNVLEGGDSHLHA